MKGVWFVALGCVALGCGADDTATSDAGAGAAPGGGAVDGGGGNGASTGGGGNSGTTGGGGSGGSTSCPDVEAFVPAWASNPTTTTEVYVSPSGDDAGDGSEAHPWKTTAKAWAARGPGVRINFKSGSYDCPPYASDLLATTASPFVVRAVDGALTATFDCGGTGDFFFSHVKAVVLDGLEITNTAGHGVQLDSGSGFIGSNDPSNDLSADFVLMHSHVHQTALAGIKAAQSQRIWVVGNEFDAIGTGRQAAEFVACDMPVIVGNDVHNADALDEVKGGAHGGIIALNRVHDMTAGAQAILVGGDCTGYQFLVDNTVDFEAKDLYVWSNVISESDGGAFRVIGCHDCVVANNTYYSSAPTAILRVIDEGFDQGSGTCQDVPTHSANVRIANNLFAWPQASTYVVASNASPSEVVMDHNLWFAAGGDVTQLGCDIPFANEPTSLYNVDPLLATPPTDLSLQDASPARGTGTAISQVGATFDGRCVATPPDIGAY